MCPRIGSGTASNPEMPMGMDNKCLLAKIPVKEQPRRTENSGISHSTPAKHYKKICGPMPTSNGKGQVNIPDYKKALTSLLEWGQRRPSREPGLLLPLAGKSHP